MNNLKREAFSCAYASVGMYYPVANKSSNRSAL